MANLGRGDLSTVSVISAASNAVVADIPARAPFGVAVTPEGKRVYVANRNGNSLSMIATATNAVIATLPTGHEPNACGQFIGPARFHFTGFFEPVLNPPALNARRAGAAVPFRFRLHTGVSAQSDAIEDAVAFVEALCRHPRPQRVPPAPNGPCYGPWRWTSKRLETTGPMLESLQPCRHCFDQH